MLSAAQEQADTTVGTAKAEADAARKSAATEAQQVVAEATRQAETAVSTAKAQAKQQLDEATARATAIHDGAERRLNLLMSRHTEAVRRLTEIRDVVTSLVAGEADRGSLEDEVARIVTGATPDGQPARPGNGRSLGPAEGRHAGRDGVPDGSPALSTAQRPGQTAGGGQPIGRTGQLPGGPGGQGAQSKGLSVGQPGTRIAASAAGTPDGDDRTDGISLVKD
jgi:hypothetical protein